MNRTVLGLLLITPCVVFGRCAHYWFESYAGFCADESPQPSERESYYLVLSERARKNEKAVRAFHVAARQWCAVGITITPLDHDAPNKPAHARDTILADINVKQCSGEHILGWGSFSRESRPASNPARIASLCVKGLESNYSKDASVWISTAQHELGHALGLWHHFGSLMKPGGRTCPDPGFTESDMNTIYDMLLADRKITHAEPCFDGRP